MILSCFDLDGTLLTKNSSFSFCTYLFRKKVLSFSQFVICLFCYFRHKTFGTSLLWLHKTIFNRIFRGKKMEEFLPYIDSFLDKYLDQLLYLPAIQRLRERLNVGEVVLLSNSPHFLVQKISKRLGISNIRATEYRVDDKGLLCDIGLLMDGKAKAECLKNFPFSEKEAYTDSILDLPFLESATIKIAVRPDRKLAKLAHQNGWEKL